MRELKFRAWDNNCKQMDYFSLNDLFEEGHGCDSDYSFMQYVGLQDKEGKDVYEGDILLIEDKNYELRYLNAAFCLFKDGKYQGIFGRKMASLSRIIGNKYQNPELL